MIGIYKITSPTNKVYIGQSVNIERRFNTYKHIIRSKFQTILNNSFLKYGIDNHKFEILEECEIHELNNKERYYQDFFDVIGKNGLNCRLTKTEDRSGKISEETKIKMKGRVFSEESRKKMSDSRKGIKPSEETREKMRKIRTGMKLSEETKIKIGNIHRGKKHTYESKINMSNGQKQSLHRLNKKHSEKTKIKMSNSQTGRFVSEETKIKISKARTGKKHSEETIFKLNKIILNTETGIYYFGAKDASETVYMNKKTLNNCLSGNNKNKTPFIYV